MLTSYTVPRMPVTESVLVERELARAVDASWPSIIRLSRRKNTAVNAMSNTRQTMSTRFL